MNPQLKIELIRRACQKSPADYAEIVSKCRWVPAKHLAFLNKYLLKVASGEMRRLMVFMPPRNGKSYLISQYFPAWYLGMNPDKRVILTSYEADFAAQWGRRARDLLTETGMVFPQKIEISPDSSSASRWDIVGHTGGMITAGAGGAITGKGGDIILCDDPVKNAEEANSKVYQDKTWEWFQSTLYTRLEPKGSIVLIMTRWSQADLAGKILQDMAGGGEKWEVLSLPALAEPGDPLGRKPGEPLWPERFPLAELEKIKRTVGSYYFHALYQQHPAPLEGGMFKRQWFKIVKAVPEGLIKVRRWDLAASQQKGDWTAGLLYGKDKEGRFYVLDLRHVRENPAGVEALIKQTAQLDGVKTAIRMEREPGSSGIGVIDHYTRRVLQGYNFKGVPSTGSKELRAQPVSAAAEAGNVYILEAEWNNVFLDEVSIFPNGAHDDIVDVLSSAHWDVTLGDVKGGVSLPKEWLGFGGAGSDPQDTGRDFNPLLGF